jgi:hypothetical protein
MSSILYLIAVVLIIGWDIRILCLLSGQHYTCFISASSHRNFNKIDRRQQKSCLTL